MNKGLNIIDHILLLVGLLVSSHHHLAELVEVHGAGAVLVELLQDALKLLVLKGSQQLGDEAPQCVRRDEALALCVVQPEWREIVTLSLKNSGMHLKASLSSLFMVSMSGSSTRKVAHSWQNSPKRYKIMTKKN